MDEENLSGAFDYERERWEQELRADPAYVEWLDYIEACASHEKEIEHGDYCC